MEVGGNEDRGVCFGTPLPVGASFGVPTTSVGPRLAPLTPNGPSGGMFLGPYHLWGQFLGYPPLLLNQESDSLPAHSPHSQLTDWR